MSKINEIKELIKKLIKEELDTKDKILFLAKDLDYIQNEYEEVLSDSELNQLSEFISQLHKKANSL